MIERNYFKEMLSKELDELKRHQAHLKRRLGKAPEGSLHVLQKGEKAPHYYHYINRKDRRYISRNHIEEAKELAQKGYDVQALEIVESRIRQAEALLREYNCSLEQAPADVERCLDVLAAEMFLPEHKAVRTSAFFVCKTLKKRLNKKWGGISFAASITSGKQEGFAMIILCWRPSHFG